MVSLAKGIRQVKDRKIRNIKITFENISSNKCNKENTHNSSEIFVWNNLTVKTTTTANGICSTPSPMLPLCPIPPSKRPFTLWSWAGITLGKAWLGHQLLNAHLHSESNLKQKAGIITDPNLPCLLSFQNVVLCSRQPICATECEPHSALLWSRGEHSSNRSWVAKPKCSVLSSALTFWLA